MIKFTFPSLSLLCFISTFILLSIDIVFIMVNDLFKNDCMLEDDEKNILIVFLFLNSYRVILYIVFVTLVLVQNYFLLIYYCIKRESPRNIRLLHLFQQSEYFLVGSLDIINMFFCFQNCMPLCVDNIQLCLDVLSLCLDVCLLLATYSLGVIFIETKRINGGNIVLVVCFFSQCLPLTILLISNVIFFIRTRKVSARVRGIFRKDNVPVRVFYEDSIGLKKCSSGDDCENTEPKHRVKYHKREDVFKLEKFDENNNIVVGFHQTSIENVKKIIKSTIRPSSEGWIGSGIYFATNFAATDKKANKKGATLVAKIDLGKVDELYARPSRSSANQISYECETRYWHHDNGPKYDQFIIRNSTQIKEYVVVVSKSAAKLFRNRGA